jgi:hypothetical protein
MLFCIAGCDYNIMVNVSFQTITVEEIKFPSKLKKKTKNEKFHGHFCIYCAFEDCY